MVQKAAQLQAVNLEIDVIHNELREKLYAPLRDSFWPELYDEEYSLADVYTISHEKAREIRFATEAVGKIYTKIAPLLRSLPNNVLVEQLGLPESSMHYVKFKSITPETGVGRADWVDTPEGLKFLEFNMDTPTFIVELFKVNGIVCDHFGYENPNAGMDQKLAESLLKLIQESAQSIGVENPYIVFSAHEDHDEDSGTVIYMLEKLKSIAPNINARYVPLEDLKVNENGLFDWEDNQIDIFYRQTYPIEHLVNDSFEEEDGEVYKVGLQIIEHVKSGNLAIINPPSAFLLQSKAVQAAIWTLHEQNQFFTEEEHSWIEKYMLPTYLENDEFIRTKSKYVKKPSFGREGDTVEIFDGDGNQIAVEKQRNYESSLPIYQKFVTMPQHKIKTLAGKENSHLLIGSFLVNGEASAFGIRAGGLITGNTSYFLPVGIK